MRTVVANTKKLTTKIENMEFITDNLKEIILAIIAILAVGIVIKIRNNKKSNKVTQKKNKVGGDMAGRDINK